MFNKVFVQLLQDSGATAYRLSKDTGISESNISLWRNSDKLPSAEALVKLADYFNVSVDYLLGRTDDSTLHRKEP